MILSRFKGLALAIGMALLPAMVPAQFRPTHQESKLPGCRNQPIPLYQKLVKSHPVFPLSPQQQKSPHSHMKALKASGEDVTLFALTSDPYGNTKVWQLPKTLGGTATEADFQFSYVFDICTVVNFDNKYFVQHHYGPELTGGEDWYILDVYLDDDGWLNMQGEVLLEPDAVSSAMALDPVTNHIYCINPAEEGGYRLFTIAFDEGQQTVSTSTIGTIPGEWNSIGIDSDGQMYGIKVARDASGVTGSTLCKIDKSNATVTSEIGETQQKPCTADGAVIDTSTNSFYWLVKERENGETRLLNVDLTSGDARIISAFESGFNPKGIFAVTKRNPDTPLAPTDVTVSFEGKSLTGIISVNVPSANLNGEQNGELSYKVTVEGQTLTGDCDYGERVQIPVTVPTDNYYDFYVKIINGTLESQATNTRAYAGRAIPPSVNPSLAFDEATNEFVVTWDEPDTQYTQGYISVGDLTYKVIRYPDEVVVADGLKSREFRESIADFPENFTLWHYTVCTYNEEIPSYSAGKTNFYPLGYATPPFKEDFDNTSLSSLAGYRIVDNNDQPLSVRLIRSLYINEYGNLGSNLTIYKNDNSSADEAWLIGPQTRLERGKTYFVKINAYISSPENPVEFQMFVSDGNTPSALVDGTKLGSWKINNTVNESGELIMSFTPQNTGLYYFGFRCTPFNINNQNDGAIHITSFEYSQGVADNAPAAPVITSIKRNINGELKADVSITLPSKDINGQTLNSIEKLDVLRNGNVIKTFDNPQPGETVSFTDTDIDKPGNFTWTAVAYNDGGAGKISDAVTAFVGQDIAAAPSDFKIEKLSGGRMRATWTPVTTDKNGNTIDPSRVSYLFKDETGSVYIKTDNTEVEFDEPTTQQWNRYAVYSINESGSDNCTWSEPIVVGPPSSEFVDRFSNGTSDHFPITTLWSNTENNAGSWALKSILSTGCFGKDIADNQTDCFIAMTGYEIDASASLITTYVDLSGHKYPAFSCYVHNLSDGVSENTNQIQVYAKALGTNEWTLLSNKTICEVAPHHYSWGHMVVSLEEFAGKTIQIKVTGIIKTFVYIPLDDIEIRSISPSDLAVESFRVPDYAEPGKEFTANVRITNHGFKSADKFDVILSAGGESTVFSGNNLASGDFIDFECPVTMPDLGDSEYLEMRAVVVKPGDTNVSNDRRDAIVAPKLTHLPRPENLTGSIDDTGRPKLEWEAPSEPYHPQVSESFSKGEQFVQHYEDWIFIDRDNYPTGEYNLSNLNVPGYKPEIDATSFMVYDATTTEVFFDRLLWGYDDPRFLAAYYRADYNESDDWAITPELDGSAQVVSFMARGLIWRFPPKFDVYYSTGSTDPDDFRIVDGMAGLSPVAGEWTKFSAHLPLGAKRMAIRSRIKGTATMLHIDHVQYRGAASIELTPQRYNIYRNGEAGPNVEDTWWNGSDAIEGSQEYSVTAYYRNYGESEPTKPVILSPTSLPSIGNDAIKVYSQEGYIIIDNCNDQQVSVYDTLGRTVFSDVIANTGRIQVVPGIYVVNIGSQSVKLVVM